MRTLLFGILIYSLTAWSDASSFSFPDRGGPELNPWILKQMNSMTDPFSWMSRDLPTLIQLTSKINPQGLTSDNQKCLRFLNKFNDKVNSSTGGLALISDKTPISSNLESLSVSSELVKVLKAIDNRNTIEKMVAELAGIDFSPRDPKLFYQIGELLKQKLQGQYKIFEFNSAVVNSKALVLVSQNKNEDVYFHIDGEFVTELLGLRFNKVNKEGKKIDPPTVDFFATIDKTDHLEKLKGASLNHCASCHRGGSVAVLPVGDHFISHTKGMSDSQIKDWWNSNRIQQVDNSHFDFNGLAPVMGNDEVPTRTPVFVKQCAQTEIPNITDTQVARIRESMDCATCHYDRNRMETLMFPTNTADFKLRILDNVLKSGHMPLGANNPKSTHYLKPEEQRALRKCLYAEYFGGLKDPALNAGNNQPGVFLNFLTANCKPGLHDPGTEVPAAGHQ